MQYMFHTAAARTQALELSRRSLLAALTIASLPVSTTAFAELAPTGADAAIKRLNDSLLATMKSGGTSFNQRFQTLAPAVDQAFDLPAILAVSVGPGWASLPPDQQSRLREAFRRYTVASYVANFDSYNGENFTVSPNGSGLPGGRIVVRSRIVPLNGGATDLDYVMQQTEAGWKIVDVLEAGSISRVAVQRSDFRHILASGGGDALLARLQRKTADLSGGSLA
jgi:phospholipid transport system substrate-binding protein